jgi:UDP-GlcNAc3NAcA epimerase
MYDAMIHYRSIAQRHSRVLQTLNLNGSGFALATVHRAENTDDPQRLAGVMRGLMGLADELPVVLPLHPRTRKALQAAQLLDEVSQRLRLIEPVGYLDMVMLESAAVLIATDSGGVQKEAYFNRVPCLTLRDETEWVELVQAGANFLVGTDPHRIVGTARRALKVKIDKSELYGDGHAGPAIVQRLIAR